jgi:copper resistance protein C
MEMTAPRRLASATAPIIGFALLTSLLLPTTAAAHAELTGTSPEADAELETPPTEVMLTFDDELQADGSAFTVTGPDGTVAGTGALDLHVADRNVLRGPVTAAQPGEYRVAWTALAGDGHEDEGSFAFTVTDATPVAPPDTALSAASGPWLAILGGILIVMTAVAVGTRRAAHP